MQFVRFIVGRLFKSGSKTENLSTPMLKISTIGIALGMAVMLVSISIVIGYKREISEKISGFSSHINLINFDMNLSHDSNPITENQPTLEKIREIPEIKHIQKFATKPGIVRLDTELQAIVLKGISADYDTTFFSAYMVDGFLPTISDSSISNQVVISKTVANKLNLKLNDRLPTYFMQKPVRVRNFVISGIFDTSFEMFDELFVLCDLRHIQRLNGWSEDEISGFEVFLHKFDDIEETTSKLRHLTALAFDENKSAMRAVAITESQRQIFDWLEMQNVNVYVIIILMILVSGACMVTGLLIMILERTEVVGILKTLGTTNKALQRIFVIRSSQIIGKGLFYGNVIGMTLIVIQKIWHPIKLDATNYYLTHVPVDFSVLYWVIINVVAFITLLAMMTLPVRYIAKLPVSDIMRFD